jgi:hypothetical protein
MEAYGLRAKIHLVNWVMAAKMIGMCQCRLEMTRIGLSLKLVKIILWVLDWMVLSRLGVIIRLAR